MFPFQDHYRLKDFLESQGICKCLYLFYAVHVIAYAHHVWDPSSWSNLSPHPRIAAENLKIAFQEQRNFPDPSSFPLPQVKHLLSLNSLGSF